MKKETHRILFVIGTRPELIKMCPVISEAKKQKIDCLVCFTGQHTDMLELVNKGLGVKADITLGIQTGSMVSSLSQILKGLPRDIDGIAVQGDTLSAFAGAILGFLEGIPVYHIEAGVRSFDNKNPYPEEGIRRFIDMASTLHLCPSETELKNLKAEGIGGVITGNTIVDVLLSELGKERYVLCTLHRREGVPMLEKICLALKDVFSKSNIRLMLIVHKNPVVRKIILESLKDAKNIRLIDPVDYRESIKLLSLSCGVITDSGGLTEEATTLNKPMLITRKKNDRPQSEACGLAKRMDFSNIKGSIEAFIKSIKIINNKCFGEGNASEKTIKEIFKSLSLRNA